MSATCRLLTITDAEAFRTIRLRSLKEHPDAFLDDYEEASTWPMEWFQKRFDTNWIAGSFMDGALVGMSGLYRQERLKTRHKGEIWGVYVAPEARGHSLGRRMIELLLTKAKEAGIELLHLSTDVTNAITIDLYKNLGFEPWGVEKHILKLPDGYVDDVVMVKFL